MLARLGNSMCTRLKTRDCAAACSVEVACRKLAPHNLPDVLDRFEYLVPESCPLPVQRQVTMLVDTADKLNPSIRPHSPLQPDRLVHGVWAGLRPTIRRADDIDRAIIGTSLPVPRKNRLGCVNRSKDRCAFRKTGRWTHRDSSLRNRAAEARVGPRAAA